MEILFSKNIEDSCHSIASSIFRLQKVKELTYMHSEGIMAGELKHGPLALVDDQMPVLMIVLRDPVYNKCINAMLQVKARNCSPILICEEGDTETISQSNKALEIPRTVDCLQVSAFLSTKQLNISVNFISSLIISGYFDGHSNAIACISHRCAARLQRRLPTESS